MKVTGSVALVTGGASGLGAGAASALVRAGGQVAILDLPTSAGADTALALGPDVVFTPADVRDTEQVKTAVAAAVSAFGRIDICVNAAGVAPAHRVVAKTGELFPIELFRFTVEVNLIGTFDVIRQVAAVMAANQPGVDGERGVIINVASIAAFEGQVGQAAYSASKAGVAGMTLPLARDLASVGIRVNTIAPGNHGHPDAGHRPPGVEGLPCPGSRFPQAAGHAGGLCRAGSGDRRELDAQRRDDPPRRCRTYGSPLVLCLGNSTIIYQTVHNLRRPHRSSTAARSSGVRGSHPSRAAGGG